MTHANSSSAENRPARPLEGRCAPLTQNFPGWLRVDLDTVWASILGWAMRVLPRLRLALHL
jgi:hypothetical protein